MRLREAFDSTIAPAGGTPAAPVQVQPRCRFRGLASFILFALLAVSVLISPLPGLSLRRAAFFAASVGLAAGIVGHVRAASGPRSRHRRFRVWLGSFVSVGTIVLVLARPVAAANELAGVSLLLLPTAALIAFTPVGRRGPWSSVLRGLTGLAALVVLWVLLDTGSRGALLSALLTLPIAVALLGPTARRWTFGAALAVVAGLLLVPRPAIRFLTDATPQGLDARVLLSGRPDIWRRAGLAVADFPLVGMGFGTFGPLADTLYPSPERPQRTAAASLEDAHQLLLQTALDLGLAAAVALTILLAIVLGRLYRSLCASRPQGSRRAVAAGLLGALSGHLLWSLGDTVALGTPGSLTFAASLGLAAALPTSRGATKGAVEASAWRSLPGPGWIMAAAPILLLVLLSQAHHQVASLAAAQAIVQDGEEREMLSRAGNCRAHWLRGLAAQSRHDTAAYRSEWIDLVRCAPRFLPQIAAAAPDDRQLARLAARLRPDSAEPYLWQARAGEAAGDRDAATGFYAAALARAPTNGRAWLSYGRLLLASDARAAAHGAFVAACHHGDPGGNGCWLAGQMAEADGEIEQAIASYRRSRWAVARQRADELATPR